MELKKSKPKLRVNFTTDEKIHKIFKQNCKDRGLSMSDTITKFMDMCNGLFSTDGGGEVVFGVEGDRWRQPKKIVYDGQEIIRINGVRQYKTKVETGGV